MNFCPTSLRLMTAPLHTSCALALACKALGLLRERGVGDDGAALAALIAEYARQLLTLDLGQTAAQTAARGAAAAGGSAAPLEPAAAVLGG